MKSPYLMTGSTCYLRPAGETEVSDPDPGSAVIPAELSWIDELLSNGRFDAVPGIDSLRSELHKVERMQSERTEHSR